MVDICSDIELYSFILAHKIDKGTDLFSDKAISIKNAMFRINNFSSDSQLYNISNHSDAGNTLLCD